MRIYLTQLFNVSAIVVALILVTVSITIAIAAGINSIEAIIA